MENLTSGKLAKLTGINTETLRYYERIGLIAEPPRGSSSGYRQYPKSVVTRIRFIKRAQNLGFSLHEIADILSLRHNPGSTFDDIKAKVAHKIDEIDEKIKALESMKSALLRFANSSDKTITKSECPVLAAFEIHTYEIAQE